MTTNKLEVVAYRYTASRSFGKRNPKWHYQESFPHAENRKVEEIGRLEELIRLSDYEALQAEIERLRKDAERYRWLKQHAFCGVWHRGDGLALVAPRVIQREVDAAIDSAMQRTSGGDHADS